VQVRDGHGSEEMGEERKTMALAVGSDLYDFE
jgi:hypothetical protein